MRKFVIALMVIGFVSLTSAQSASISNVNPASKSVTVGQSFSVQVSYSTNSVNSCTLGFVDSSIPDNWESSGQVSVSTTGGSTSTTSSPKITTASPATETDLTLELQCSSNSVSPRDTSSFHVTANNPPFLEGNLEGDNSIDVSSGETYTVTFSASNSGSSQTEAARAVISSPSGFSHPSSLSLKEAGQDDGVIRPGKSTGTYSFDLTAEDSFSEGTLTVEFTSSEIGTTDSFEIDLNNPSSNNNRNNNDNDNGGSGGGGGLPPGLVGNETDEENRSQSDTSEERPETPGTKRVTAESRNGVARVTIQKGEGVRKISVDVDPASDRAPVKRISISSDSSGQVSVSVRDMGREKPVQVPEPASENSENVYSYQEINTSINDTEVEAAEIDFSVNRSWLESRNRTTEDVIMKRYSSDPEDDQNRRMEGYQEWEELQTRHVNSTESVHNFEASSTGFSYYAVALQEQETDTPGNETTDTPDQEEQNLPVIPIVLVLTLVMLVAAAYVKRDELLGMMDGQKMKRKKLERKMDSIREGLENGGLDEEEREDVLESVERADNLIQQDELDKAEKIINRVQRKVED